MTKEQRHLGRISSIGCIVCLQHNISSPAICHHIRDGRGLAQRSSDFLAIPLCIEHHVGKDSVHMDYRGFVARYGSELELLAETLSKVYGDIR